MRSKIVWFIIILLCGVIVLEYTNIFSHFLLFRMLLAWTGVMFLPGYFISKKIFRKREYDFAEKVVYSFSLSFGAIFLLGLFGYGFHLNITFLNSLFLLMTVFFCIMYLSTLERNYLKEEYVSENKNGSIFLRNSILFLMILLLSIIAFVYQAKSWGDVYFYESIVRKLAELPHITNQNVFCKDIKPDTVFGSNIWFLIMAMIVNMSKIDTIEVWLKLPAILMFLKTAIIYVFAHELFKNKKISLVITGLYFFYSVLHLGDIQYLGYNFHFAVSIILPLALLMMLRYIRIGQKEYLILSSLLGVSLFRIHIMVFFLFELALLSFLVGFWLFQKEEKNKVRNLVRLISFSLISAIPFIIYTLSSYNLGTVIDIGKEYTVKVTKYLFFIKLDKFLEQPLVLTGLVFTPLLLPFLKRKDWAIFLFMNMVVPPILMLIPIFPPLLGKIITVSLVRRINFLMPSFFVIGGGIAFLFMTVEKELNRYIFEERGKKIITYAIYLVVTFLVFSSSILAFRKMDIRNWDIKETNPDGIYEFFRKSVAPNTVVLADLIQSVVITSYSSKVYVVGVAAPHLRGDPSGLERERDVRKVLNEPFSFLDVMAILKKYSVNYIVLPENRSICEFEVLPYFFKREKFNIIKVVSLDTGNLMQKARASLQRGIVYLDNGEYELADKWLCQAEILDPYLKEFIYRKLDAKTQDCLFQMNIRLKNNDAKEAFLLLKKLAFIDNYTQKNEGIIIENIKKLKKYGFKLKSLISNNKEGYYTYSKWPDAYGGGRRDWYKEKQKEGNIPFNRGYLTDGKVSSSPSEGIIWEVRSAINENEVIFDLEDYFILNNIEINSVKWADWAALNQMSFHISLDGKNWKPIGEMKGYDSNDINGTYTYNFSGSSNKDIEKLARFVKIGFKNTETKALPVGEIEIFGYTLDEKL